MKLNKEVNIQRLTEKNEKILDLDDLEFILSESEENEVLADLIRKISQNKEINRILIIGDNLIPIYSRLILLFPGAEIFIANKSKESLESFEEHYDNQNNYSTYILDVLKGVSLHDFIYSNSKFDLVIANKLYSKVKKKKRYYSIRFLYKFYLNHSGILCLIDYIRKSKKQKLNPLKPMKPILEKKIPVKKEKVSIQFLFYIKKNRY